MICKEAEGLRECLKELERIGQEELPSLSAENEIELFQAFCLPNQWQVAKIIAQSALLRQESRGPHYRTDFPNRDDKNWGKSLVVTKRDGDLQYKQVKL